MTPVGLDRPLRGCRPQAVRGVSLLELLIVITIIAIMVTMLFPALQMVRHASQTTACDNNVRQLVLAISQYQDLSAGFVPLPPDGVRPSGWVFAILPFMEEAPLVARFNFTQPLNAQVNLDAGWNCPELFTCPATPWINSTMDRISVSNYVLSVDTIDLADRSRRRRNRPWRIKDASEGSRFPWVTSPEVLNSDPYTPPHDTAFGF